MSRPSWEETWAGMAQVISRRSACGKRQVGAVIVSADQRTHWIGYNGPPTGFWAPLEADEGLGCGNYCPQGSGDPEGFCVSVHAEINALIQSDRSRRLGGSIFITAAPCWKCALAIANSGLRRVHAPGYELERLAEGVAVSNMLEACNVAYVPL